MLNVGQKVIVKKTGEIGRIVLSHPYYERYTYNIFTLEERERNLGWLKEEEIHPLKFEVREWVTHHRTNEPKKIIGAKWCELLQEPQYQLSELQFILESKLEKVEEPKVKKFASPEMIKAFAEHIEEQNIKLMDYVKQYPGKFPAWERIFKRAKEKEMQEPKFKMGDFVKTNQYCNKQHGDWWVGVKGEIIAIRKHSMDPSVNMYLVKHTDYTNGYIWPMDLEECYLQKIICEKEIKEIRSGINEAEKWHKELKETIRKAKEQKFKVGDRVITANVSSCGVPHAFEGQEAIIECVRFSDYLVRYISDNRSYCLRDECLKKVDELKRYNPLNLKFGEKYWRERWNDKPSVLLGSEGGAYFGSYYFSTRRQNGEEYVFDNTADSINEDIKNEKFMLYSDYLERERIKKMFKYPDLVVGKKYNLEYGLFGPYEFVDYTKDRYVFKNNDGNFGNSWNDDEENAWYAGKITEHVEPETKPESVFDYPNLIVGRSYILEDGAYNPYVFMGYGKYNDTIDCYKFKDRDGDLRDWWNKETGPIKESQEPYSKEFYVCYDPAFEPAEDDKQDQLLNLFTTSDFELKIEDAKFNMSPLERIKKFRITEVPIDEA